MKVSLSVAAIVAALIAASAAEAGHRRGHGWHHGHGGWHHHHRGRRVWTYGGGFGVAGPMLVEYREPYIGRGLVYNVPTSAEYARAGWGGSTVLHAKY